MKNYILLKLNNSYILETPSLTTAQIFNLTANIKSFVNAFRKDPIDINGLPNHLENTMQIKTTIKEITSEICFTHKD